MPDVSQEASARWVDGDGIEWAYRPCDAESCVVESARTDAERLVVPASVDGLEVVAVAPEAFVRNPHLREVVLPATLRSVGYKAFAYCTALENVEIGAGLREVEPYAFMSTALTRFDAPAALESIGEKAFFNCAGLADVTLNDGLAAIGSQAFAGTAIDELHLPRTLANVGARIVEPHDSAQQVCLRVAEGNAVYATDADGTALYRRESDGLVLVEYWGVGPRAEVLPGTVAIAPHAFAYRTMLEEVVLPEGLIEIGEGAFHRCASLMTLTLPETLKALGPRVFVESRLRCLTLPASLEELCDDSLILSDGVRVTVAGPSPVIDVDEANPHFFLRDGLLYRRDGDGGETALLFAGASTAVHIPRSVTRVGSRLLFGATGVKELVVHDGLEYFGSQAFATVEPVSYVRIELNEPVDGADAVELQFSLQSGSRMNFISAFAGGVIDAQRIAVAADAGIRFFFDHYAKGRVIMRRLLNPVCLDAPRAGYLREQLANVLEPLCRGLAERNLNEGFKQLSDLGALDGDAIDRALGWARDVGSTSAVGYLLQLKRERDGADPMSAYEL